MDMASHGCRRRARPLAQAAALMVCGLILPGAVAAQVKTPAPRPPKMLLGWCQFAESGGRSVYYTRVFAETSGAAAEAAGNAFLAHLSQQYGLEGASFARAAPACQWRSDLSSYMVGKLRDADKSAAILRNQKVVDTDWAPG